MDLVERGAAIKRRRLALGLANVNQFAAAAVATRERDGNRLDRGTLTKAEQGEASPSKMDEIEHWLETQEVENGHDEDDDAGTIEVTMRGVYGVDELIVKGSPSNPDALAQAVSLILDQLKNRQ